MNVPFTTITLPCIAAAAFVGCGGSDSPGPSVVRSDSAGVEIVENHAAAWDQGEAWRLGEQPTVQIGGVDVDPNYELYRVAGATRLRDGRIVVANHGSSELRFYDGGGRFSHAVGRDGEGPGEFRYLYGVWSYRSDSIAAFDQRLARWSVFDLDGEFARSVQLPAWNADPKGVFTDGSILSTNNLIAISGTGVEQQFVDYVTYAPDGSVRDSLPRQPSWRSIRIEYSSGGTFIAAPIFGARTAAAAAGRYFFVGYADAYEFRVYAPEGGLRRIVRWTGPDQTVKGDYVGRERDLELKQATSRADSIRTRDYYEAVPVADRLPAYRLFTTDVEGNLWVQAFQFSDETGPVKWTVFTPDGVRLGDVETPRDVWIFEIGADYVLGRLRDDLDVEYVQLYDLVKP
jgi:hypothetical protein